MNCANHEDVSTCPSVTMKSGYYQCCRFHMSIQYYDYDSGRYESPKGHDICNVWVAFDYSDEQIESMQKSYQEAVTFLTLNYKYYIPIIQNTYTCPKKTFTFNYGKGSFTDEEIAIMKDENYCLRLYYEGLYQLGYISNIIGENELANHKDKNKNKTINDIISNIKSQMLSDNTTTSDAITKSK